MDARAPQTTTAPPAPATPVDRLRSLVRLRDAWRAGEPLPVDAVELVAGAVDAMEAGAEPAEAFGLALAPGEESPHRTLARERRDAFLAAALFATEGATPWARARGLADAVRDFQGRQWPRWRRLPEPPGNATPQQRALYQAARAAEAAGLALPTSPKALAAMVGRGNQTRVFTSTPGRCTTPEHTTSQTEATP
ncbi:hypothetical protein [Thioalkalivibrio sulfidiphilus]|uniref:hypothetical protein n=1 Tax=Thioalkalivibrio sulfidiphilus TaxID=1033854 RepID=UPI003B303882